MKFTVKTEEKNTKARLGTLSGAERLPNLEVQTPLLMFYTRGGSIPHITHEVLQLITTEPQTIQIPLVSTVQFVQPVEAWDRPLADFIGLTEHLTCVTVQDPGDYTPTGKHRQDSVPIWTKSGKVEITADKYMDMVETFKPDMYYTLSDGDTNISSPKKRISKAVDRTIQFFDLCLQRHKKSEVLKNKLLLAAIAGGYSLPDREKCIAKLLKDDCKEIVGGYLIDGIHNNGPELELANFDEIRPVIEKTIELLPNEKIRAIHGCWNPLAIIDMVMIGIDIFDSSFPYIVTERSAALTFNFIPNSEMKEKFEINLRDATHSSSFEPLYGNCECLACRKHTRAYIYHLLNVQELLGTVLLTIHNLHHYLTFFKQIRDAIQNNNLMEMHCWIKNQYAEYQTSLLDSKPVITTPITQVNTEFQGEGDTIRRALAGNTT